RHRPRRRRARAGSPASPPRRSACGATGGSRPEHEADPADGLDQGGLTELAPQIRDVAIHDIEARGRRPTPDPVEGELPADDPARVAKQELEQVGLAGAQAELTASTPCRPGGEVEDEIAESQDLLRLSPAPEERPDARDELLGRERLDEVVVGARVEPGDAIRDSVAGG